MKKVLKEAGAKRVNDEALNAMHSHVNKLVFRIASRSVKLAKHAKRKTVEIDDIRLALQE
ncbi:MAG: NFYB/HAP3 family transcription factor subunit [Candidatus Marsarchaeota archaeon]|nr:NFYB/HAP3 family transcription factor subunit [Candidatus Marsarchaeota archaeon]